MKYGAIPVGMFERLAFLVGKVPLPVLDLLLGPIQSQALIAAEKVGALAALGDGEATAKDLSERLDVDAECLGLVLRLLRAMGYVELHGDRFALSTLGQRHFGSRAPEPYHAFLQYGPPQWEMVAQLEQVLRSGQGIDFHATQTLAEWEAYQKAMLDYAVEFSWFVAENVPVPAGAKSCLDLAGSAGLVGAKLCERHPELRSTVLDLPAALRVARPLAEARGYTDKVAFREGDLLTDDYGEGHDVVLMCNILHHFSEETNRAILKKVHAALRPGGSVGIFDIETPEDAAPPETAGDAFALFFRITSTSSCYRGRDYEAWLDGAGFRSVRTIRSVKMPSRMLVVAAR